MLGWVLNNCPQSKGDTHTCGKGSPVPEPHCGTMSPRHMTVVVVAWAHQPLSHLEEGRVVAGHAPRGWLGGRGHAAPPLLSFVPGPQLGHGARPQGRAQSWGTMPRCFSRWRGGRWRTTWGRNARSGGGSESGKASLPRILRSKGVSQRPRVGGGWDCQEARWRRVPRPRDHLDWGQSPPWKQ